MYFFEPLFEILWKCNINVRAVAGIPFETLLKGRVKEAFSLRCSLS